MLSAEELWRVNEISQAQKDKYSMIPSIWGTWLFFNEYQDSVCHDGKVQEMDSTDSHTTMWTYLMPLNCALKKRENGKVYGCIFYCNKEGIKATFIECTDVSESTPGNIGAAGIVWCQLYVKKGAPASGECGPFWPSQLCRPPFPMWLCKNIQSLP